MSCVRSYLQCFVVGLSFLLAANDLATAQNKIMPLGDLITKGAVDPAPSVSGYRARLFDLLEGWNLSLASRVCGDGRCVVWGHRFVS